MSTNRDSGPTVTITYVLDLKVDLGTDLAKLERDIQDLMSGAPVEVKEVEIHNLGITEEAKLDPVFKNMIYIVEPLTTGTTTWVEEVRPITPQEWITMNQVLDNTLHVAFDIETPQQGRRR